MTEDERVRAAWLMLATALENGYGPLLDMLDENHVVTFTVLPGTQHFEIDMVDRDGLLAIYPLLVDYADFAYSPDYANIVVRQAVEGGHQIVAMRVIRGDAMRQAMAAHAAGAAIVALGTSERAASHEAN